MAFVSILERLSVSSFNEVAPDDLMIVLPTDIASRSEVSVYRDKGDLLLFSKPLISVPRWLHSLFEYTQGGELADRR